MGIFGWIVLIIVLAVAIVLLLALMKPNAFRLERSASIRAAPEKVFALVNDFHEWTKWSPWENIDAQLKRDYGGAPAGKGATYGWEGKKTGRGRMEIVESVPSSKVGIKLDFIKPFEAHNLTEFSFLPEVGGTRVNWVMSGPMPFMSKLFTTFVSMDKMVGKDFEKGLAQMKAAAER